MVTKRDILKLSFQSDNDSDYFQPDEIDKLWSRCTHHFLLKN